MNLTELSKQIHETAKSKGFYEKERNFGELLMLCVTELAEALQADRKGGVKDLANGITKRVEAASGNDEFIQKYEHWIKDAIPQELAGAIVRILDLCAYLGIDIQKFVDLEMRYNELRPHKHGRKY